MIVLDFLVSPQARRGFVSRGRLNDLALSATDMNWNSGSGEPVAGKAEAIMMAIAGRGVALDELAGDGVATLRARIEDRA